MFIYLIYSLFYNEKITKKLFQTFCPWTIQFSTVETPIVHKRRVFYTLHILKTTRNAKKQIYKSVLKLKTPISTNKKTTSIVRLQKPHILISYYFTIVSVMNRIIQLKKKITICSD